jgi:glycosyltransferase involved in cell wall biosynthesis
MESRLHNSALTSILAADDETLSIPIVPQESFSICLIGGIYGKDDAYRAKVKITPETVLEKGLRERGHRVVTLGHRCAPEFDRFDIVHVHHLGYAAIRAAISNSKGAFVYTSHDPLAMSGMLDQSQQLVAKFVMSRADAVIALSPTEVTFQSKTYPLTGAMHRVIPNGIDTKNYRYSRKDRAHKGQQWKLLFVGQLIEQKGVNRLLEALVLLPRNIELQLAFHVDALRDELERLTRKLGLEDRVQFLGRKSPDELSALYLQSDIFVLPSLGEALPSVITEAMICGIPIVATDVGGVKDQLGSYGVVVPPGKTEELATAIRYVLDHYEELSNASEQMSRYAQQRFSIDTMV